MRAEDVDLKRLVAVLAVAYERDLRDFVFLLLLEKLGPRTLPSLAVIAEMVNGAPVRDNGPRRAIVKSSMGCAAWTNSFVRWKNAIQPDADFDAIIRHEHAISREIAGRTVMDLPAALSRATRVVATN